MPHLDPLTGAPYRPQDFYVGAYVTVRSMLMRLTRADEFTLKSPEQERTHTVWSKGLDLRSGFLRASGTPARYMENDPEGRFHAAI